MFRWFPSGISNQNKFWYCPQMPYSKRLQERSKTSLSRSWNEENQKTDRWSWCIFGTSCELCARCCHQEQRFWNQNSRLARWNVDRWWVNWFKNVNNRKMQTESFLQMSTRQQKATSTCRVATQLTTSQRRSLNSSKCAQSWLWCSRNSFRLIPTTLERSAASLIMDAQSLLKRLRQCHQLFR